MGFTSADIKELREKSGAGMMDCKKALDESNGDVEKANEWLRKKGINTAQKKSSRSASEGLVTVNILENKGVIIEINSETDFVARNENFQKFCRDVSSSCIKNQVENIEDILSSEYLDSKETVQSQLTDIIAKIGENIVIKKLKFINSKENKLQKYIHNSINDFSGKIGVLLNYSCKSENENVNELSKNLCMHIAASDPKSLDIQSLDKTLIDKEKSIYKEQLKSSDKPDNIVEKIVDGKIKKYYDEVCLLEQFFVMDNKLKIKDLISDFNSNQSENFQISNYYIFKLGQE
ncbi:MAG: translation elongation factor Ts [Alphaproteobacteria bacterium]|tara:strand:- start:271 stop:1143 length:873 start_codon:yes stop_codon:yes gene_type:complete